MTPAERHVLTARELSTLLADPAAVEACSVVAQTTAPWLIVDLHDAGRLDRAALPQPACVVIGLHDGAATHVPEIVDVVADSDQALEALCQAIAARPVASTVLVQVLRHNSGAPVHAGLLVESLAYSTLQHGAEFRAWLAARGVTRTHTPERLPDDPDPVRVERAAELLRITLDRPARRNAYSRAMRDALCSALEVACHDAAVTRILLTGAGPAFCAGGDLDEFGHARDAALAHATRMTRNAATLLHRLRERVVCEVHGACIGAGIELPAFAGHIRAQPDSFFQLPEVGMGLIPGAGGTVSITHRIGRLRTAQMALTRARIDAPTALHWGLIDTIVDDGRGQASAATRSR
ncbi:MAG: enoyl-CoA hydratase/isomerase family protein [Pseudomonadales bacterium]|nr:enoyl-CoA hydratase/isomerase family protein [Pseudomonadales bacterium]